MEDMGVTNKSSVTMYIDGPLTNVDFAIEDLESANLNDTNISGK